jgi:hypothetical protein
MMFSAAGRELCIEDSRWEQHEKAAERPWSWKTYPSLGLGLATKRSEEPLSFSSQRELYMAYIHMPLADINMHSLWLLTL